MYLLDTNVVSELRKGKRGRGDPDFAAWAASVESESLYISAITIQDLEIGVLLAERRDPSTGAVLRNWLDRQVFEAFHRRIQRTSRTRWEEAQPVSWRPFESTYNCRSCVTG